MISAKQATEHKLVCPSLHLKHHFRREIRPLTSIGRMPRLEVMSEETFHEIPTTCRSIQYHLQQYILQEED